MKPPTLKNSAERRQYIRLDSVFPVRCRPLSAAGSSPLCGWLQGFTSDIGHGGICLALHSLPPEILAQAKNLQLRWELEIEIPLGGKVVKAVSKVAWFQDKISPDDNYLIGLTYEFIPPRENQLILRYARKRQLFVPVTIVALAILVLGWVIAGMVTAHLYRKNNTLVARLANAVQAYSAARIQLQGIDKESNYLRGRIQGLEVRLKAAQEEKNQTNAQQEAMRNLNIIIQKISQEKAMLQEKLSSLQSRQSRALEDVERLNQDKAALEKVNLEEMYQWLCAHQNPRTGLVMSFEGDPAMADWAFIYDQSLAGQAYILYQDYPRAKKMLEFFDTQAKRSEVWFFNAYYCRDGTPAEAIVHTGPNIWLGILAAQYTAKTKDKSYLRLATDIAEEIMDMQQSDSAGGIPGGPAEIWYSTEHNLDAYALFGMLYALTSQEKYRTSQEKTLQWLTSHAYDRPDIPIKRGKGDSTIATDTYAWSIASVGPRKLKMARMDPDGIMDFALKNCGVEVSYLRPEGPTLRLKGFDFSASRNLARGGIISAEWTAQMVIAFKIMARYWAQEKDTAKSRDYQELANDYLSTLSSMVITSPSVSGQGKSCLPYASQEVVDTGHGWVTPRGKSTGSLAATAFALLAYRGYNPLELQK